MVCCSLLVIIKLQQSLIRRIACRDRAAGLKAGFKLPGSSWYHGGAFVCVKIKLPLRAVEWHRQDFFSKFSESGCNRGGGFPRQRHPGLPGMPVISAMFSAVTPSVRGFVHAG